MLLPIANSEVSQDNVLQPLPTKAMPARSINPQGHWLRIGPLGRAVGGTRVTWSHISCGGATKPFGRGALPFEETFCSGGAKTLARGRAEQLGAGTSG